ncbi:branched-chain amino acid ABC transporter permease [Phaeobacter inhibens]|uniref:branched-chain amino acid ABC transporter permease n=1 Tax=Phaeobacter inhibens TaxID=221822 RepID=UPI0021A6582D|nr:branched-chain amino acid ABC transporter permease [Phaeobacter inhibens]
MSAAIGILMNGLFLGGLYALFGLGLSLIFGVMRIANIAHGELAIAGALALFTLSSGWPFSPLLLMPLVCTGAFAFGWLLQTQLLNRVLSPNPMPALLVTFGLSVVMQNAMVGLYGANSRSIDLGAVKTANLTIAGQTIGWLPLGIFLLSLALFGGLHLVLRKTRPAALCGAADRHKLAARLGVLVCSGTGRGAVPGPVAAAAKPLWPACPCDA